MFFGKAKYVIDDGSKLYFEDGKISSKKLLVGNYIPIKIIKEPVNCSKTRPTIAKYILQYKTEEGQRYCYSNYLTTSFLKKILEVLYPKEDIFFIKVSSKLGLLIFKDNFYVIRGENEEDLKRKIENILQGLPYREIHIKEIEKKVKVSFNFKKILGISSLILLTLGGGIGVYQFLLGGEEEETQQAHQQTLFLPKVKKIILEKKELPYEKSLMFLNEILTAPLGLYAFIPEVDFDKFGLKLASFIPLPRFKPDTNGYYSYSVILSKRIEKSLKNLHRNQINYKLDIVLSNYRKCLVFLNQFPIEESSDNYISYAYKKTLDTTQVYKFLQKLTSCPLRIKGKISYVDLLHRNVDLHIYLYTPQFTLSLLK